MFIDHFFFTFTILLLGFVASLSENNIRVSCSLLMYSLKCFREALNGETFVYFIW